MPPSNETVKALQIEARAAYEKHNAPETRGAARLQRGQVQVNGNAAAASAARSRR